MSNSVSVNISEKMQSIAAMLERRIEKVSGRDDCAFIFLVTDKNGQIHYAANCDREDSAGILYSLLQGWANRDDHVADHVRDMIKKAGPSK